MHMARERIVYGEAIRKALLARSKRRRVWLGERADHPDDRGDEPAVRYQEQSEKSQSYVVSCSNQFRDAVLDLAQRKGVKLGDLASAVMLLAPEDVVMLWPDPGEPESSDSGTARPKSSPDKSKSSRLKPKLQVRMTAGLDSADIRRMLAIALAIDEGDLSLRLTDGRKAAANDPLRRAKDEIARLRKRLRAGIPDPLQHAVRTRAEAKHVMGFAPAAEPEPEAIRKRYRALAAIHHPDSDGGDHTRMSQLNAAVRILRRR